MSAAGVNAKKKWMRNYFIKHPDSRIIEIVGGGSFPAVFDFAYMSNNKDGGNVEQQKQVPHLTFFSEQAELLTARVTELDVPTAWDENELPISFAHFTVYKVSADETLESFQADAWLL